MINVVLLVCVFIGAVIYKETVHKACVRDTCAAHGYEHANVGIWVCVREDGAIIPHTFLLEKREKGNE